MIQKLLFSFLIFALSACASAPSKNHLTSDDINSRPYVEISFPRDLAEADDFVVANETDAKSLVLFALKLEEKLKFAEAATFFHEAADLQEKGAPASRFRLSCLGAAAMCWLKAGEDEQFHVNLKTPIIPNSQLIVFSNLNPVETWQVELFTKPDLNLYLIMISCALVLFLIGILIIILHVSEKNLDKAKTQLPDF